LKLRPITRVAASIKFYLGISKTDDLLTQCMKLGFSATFCVFSFFFKTGRIFFLPSKARQGYKRGQNKLIERKILLKVFRFNQIDSNEFFEKLEEFQK
jgi:hypothetical protein